MILMIVAGGSTAAISQSEYDDVYFTRKDREAVAVVVPKKIRGFIQILAYILYPFYILAQLISILDIFDTTGRFTTYYFVVAGKR